LTQMAEGSRFIVCRRVPGHGFFYAQTGGTETSQLKNAYKFPTFNDAQSHFYKLGDLRWTVKRVADHWDELEAEAERASAAAKKAKAYGSGWSRIPSSSPSSRKVG
jgi:hypothetical protein